MGNETRGLLHLRKNGNGRMARKRTIRLTAEQRQSIIVSAAYRCAKKSGLGSITFRSVAEECSTPTTEYNVKFHFANKARLMRAIIKEHSDDSTLMNQASDLGLA